MKRILRVLCSTVVCCGLLVPVRAGRTNAVSFTEVDTIGVMPSDYVGTMTIESVNTVEDDYPSAFAFPEQGIAVLADGTVAVCDTAYGRIHILSADLVHLRVIGSLGSGRGQLQYPTDVAGDAAGNIYVTDFFADKVVKYSAAGTVQLEFGREGKGAGEFSGPAGIAVLPDGTIWVADQMNNRLQHFTADGTYIAAVTGISRPAGMTAAGSVPYVIASGTSTVYRVSGTSAVRVLAAPGDGENRITSGADLAVDNAGNIYVADRGTGDLPVPAVKMFSASGTYLRAYGQYPEDPADIQEAELLTPGGVAVGADGCVYAVNSGFFRGATNPFGSGLFAKVIRYAPGGGVVAAQEYPMGSPGRLNNPQDVAIDEAGQLWVACSKPVISADGQTIDWNRGYVAVLDASGNMLLSLTQAGSRSMEQVLCVAAGPDGLVYIGAQDPGGGFIAVYDAAGTFRRTIAAGKVDEVADLEVAGDGTLWACNQTDDTIVHLSAEGAELGRFQVPAMPGGLAVLADGTLLVCLWGGDTEVQQVFHVTPAGTVLAKFGTPGGGRGTGQMYYPHDAVQLPDGLVLVSDAENGRFIAFRLDGSVAWTTTRSWYMPGRMAWTSSGTLCVTDGFHNVVRELSYGAAAPARSALTARFDTPERQARAGGTATFQLALRNRSAQPDTAVLNVTPYGTGDWSASLSAASVQLPAGGTAAVSVAVQTPPDTPAGSACSIAVQIRSSRDPTAVTEVKAIVIIGAPALIVGGSALQVGSGSTIEIPLEVQNAQELYAAACRVTYDATALELVGVTAGSLAREDGLFLEDHSKSGMVTCAATLTDGAPPVSSDGTLALLTFHALKAVTTELDIDQAQAAGGAEGKSPLPCRPRSILVHVASHETPATLTLRIGSPVMTVNGSAVALDTAPIIIESRTLVPIRAVVEALGGTVSWDDSARRVGIALGGTDLSLVVGQPQAILNGAPTPIDPDNPRVVPRIVNGRTLLPLRFVGESLGADVQWRAETQTIIITWPAP